MSKESKPYSINGSSFGTSLLLRNDIIKPSVEATIVLNDIENFDFKREIEKSNTYIEKNSSLKSVRDNQKYYYPIYTGMDDDTPLEMLSFDTKEERDKFTIKH